MAAPANSPTKFIHGVNGLMAVTPYPTGTETYLNYQKAELSLDPGMDDITHSGFGGWFGDMPGIQKITGSVTFTYDLANSPFLAPQYLRPGSLINLKIILNAQASPGNLPGGLSVSDANNSQTYSGVARVGAWGPNTGPMSGPTNVTVPFTSYGPWVVPTT